MTKLIVEILSLVAIVSAFGTGLILVWLATNV